MAWFTRRSSTDSSVRDRLDLVRGERVLATASGTSRGPVTAVVTSTRFVVIDDAGERTIDRRWLDVDTGTWRSEDDTLHVSWVGQPTAWRLVLPDDARPLLEAFRERVQASVVATSEVAAPGGGTGRVAVRRDFATGSLVVQRIRGRGAGRIDDPELDAALDAAEADLREAVGLR